jgi:hypothetical protein
LPGHGDLRAVEELIVQVRLFDRLKARMLLLVTSPTMLPVVPPLPNCSVPPLIVVPPV